MGRVRSRKRRVRDDDFIVGSGRISSDIVGFGRMWSDYRRIVFLLAEAFREFPLKSWASRFRGRRSVWWGWTVILLAPRIGNEVAYVTQIIDDLHFARQAQYLVRLQGAFACSAHWKWGCICDADHWWLAFCVAGAVFGEVRVGLFLAGAALRDILGDSRSAKCCILQYKIVSKMGRVRSPKRRVRDDDFIVGLCSDIVGYRRIVFLSAEALQGFSDYILSFKISWQVQYLMRLGGDFTGSTHWKWGFICDADHRWHSFCVAGAVFGEVGGWLYLLHALEMTFHMWCGARMRSILRGRRSICWIWIEGWLDWLRALEMTFHMWRRSLMTFILRGRRSIWWGWRVTFLAPRIGNDVSYVTQIIDDIHSAWQAQYLVKLDGDSSCTAHCKWRFKSSTGVVRCSTGVVQSSTGVVLCSTGVVLCSTE